MWARISEIVLGLWLIFSYFLFSYASWAGPVSGCAMIFFALLSYKDTLNKMHLFQTLPAGLLLYQAYFYPTHLLPMGLQNYIVTALLLLMFTIVPSHASDHPNPWKEFLDRQDERSHSKE